MMILSQVVTNGHKLKKFDEEEESDGDIPSKMMSKPETENYKKLTVKNICHCVNSLSMRLVPTK